MSESVAVLLKAAGSLRDAGRLDEAEIMFRRVLRLEPHNVAGLIGIADVARLGGDTESAITHYQAASAARPDDLGIHATLRNLLIEQSRFDWKVDLAKALDILRRPGSRPADRLAACRLLIQYGVTGGLAEELAALSHQYPQAGDLLRAAQQLERSGLARPVPHTGADGEPENDDLILSFGVTEKPVAGSDTLVLVFGGANHRLGLSFDIIQRILRPTAVSTLYVRDLRRAWYLDGIVGLGKNFSEAVDGLRSTQERLGAKRVLAIANCLGCAGAIRYGLAIGAEAILGLSPRIRIPDLPLADSAMRDKLSRLRDAVPMLSRDVRDQYESALPRPRLTLIYGEECTEDAADARYMAGTSGVTTAGIVGYSGHGCLQVLLGRGLLTPVLHEFVYNGQISADLLGDIEHAAEPPPVT